MKKLKFVTIFALTIFMLSNFQIQGQTGLSGTGSNTCATPAGTTGARSTFVGCGAGWANNNGGGSFNTFIGDNAGFNSINLSGNVGVGHKALFSLSTGIVTADSTHNVALGNYALYTVNPNTSPVSNGYRNTAMGHRAAFSTTVASNSVAVGYKALFSNIDANNNTALGFQALASAAGGNDADMTAVGYNALANANGTTNGGLTAVGSEALLTISSGRTQSTAVGYHSLRSNTGTGPCTAVGSNSLQDNDGEGNTAVGSEAAYYNPLGDFNSVFGNAAGRGVVNNSNSHNTFLGNQSGTGITTGSYNTFAGAQSGFSNTTGQYNVFSGYLAGYSNTTSGNNAFFGYQAGYSNTAGYNTYIGSQCGYANTSSSYNAFLGYQAGYNNTGSRNTLTGYQAALNNTSGGNNSAYGYRALYSNTIGSNNTAFGYSAISSTTGGNNTAIGLQAGSNNTTGTYNTFLGQATGGANNTTGTYNTFVGYGAIASGNYTNATAVGNGAIVNNSNEVRVGNTNVTLIGGQVGWTGSDGRFKFNVQENVKGLDFILKLRPVTYQLNAQKLEEFFVNDMPDSIKVLHMQAVGDCAPTANRIRSGFIAQEVLKALNDCGYQCDIVNVPADTNKSNLSLAYAEIVVPLVKAVQELSNKYDSLLSLVNPVNTRLMNNNSNNGGKTTTHEIKLNLPDEIIMSEVRPNPNDGKAEIDYFLPQSIAEAKMVFVDMLGNIINEVNLSNGYGTIMVDTHDLPSGNYSFTLLVNGKVYDSKKMLRY